MNAPHPLTIASIERQGIDRRGAITTMYHCGCDRLASGAWRLCGYHDGYDDGVDAAEVAHARTLGGAA